MKITSANEAKQVLKVGMIVNTFSDYECKVLSLGDEVKCINVEYEDDDYKEVGKPFLRTYTDFIGNEI